MVLCAAKLSVSEILFQFLQLHPHQHSCTDGISLISHGYFLSFRSSSESFFFLWYGYIWCENHVWLGNAGKNSLCPMLF